MSDLFADTDFAPRAKYVSRGELGAGDPMPPGPYKVGMTCGPNGETSPPWTVQCGDGRAVAGHVPSREIAIAITDSLNGFAGRTSGAAE